MKKLSLDGEAFDELKADFDDVLSETMAKMQSTHAPEGCVTVRLNISLEGVIDADGEFFYRPRFEHSVGTNISLKGKKSGVMPGKWRLCFDDEQGVFCIKGLWEQERLDLEGEEE